MFELRTVEKYGRRVWQHELMDTLRRTECLCLNCVKQAAPECEIAQRGYALCQEYSIAYAVTRCPDFEKAE